MSSPSNNKHSVVTCTRVWCKDDSSFPRISEFIERALLYSDAILIAVRVEEDRAGTLEWIWKTYSQHPETKHVQAVAITPWNSFTTALNTLIYQSAQVGADSAPAWNIKGTSNDHMPEFILFQSIEVVQAKKHVLRMAEHLRHEQDGLVVGSRLPNSHEFYPGELVELTGLTSPWNTNAMWHLKSLAKTGFIMVSDGISGNTGAAIEEVATISLHQMIKKGRWKAFLIDFQSNEYPPIQWLTGFESSEIRRKQHLDKMATKNPRAKAQLELIGISHGIIHHIVV